MSSHLQFPWQQAVVIHHSQLLLHSFKHWTGRSLLDVSGSREEIAQQLFEAPFVLVSHGTEPTQFLITGIGRRYNSGS